MAGRWGPTSVRDLCKINIVDAPARAEPHSQLRHGLRGDVGVSEMVAENGGPESQGFQCAKARKRSRLIRIEFRAFRNAGRVGRGETGIDSYAANHCQDRVGVGVDEARRHHAIGQFQQPFGGMAALRCSMSQPHNFAVADTDRTVTDLGLAGVSRENSASREEKVEVIQFGNQGLASHTALFLVEQCSDLISALSSACLAGRSQHVTHGGAGPAHVLAERVREAFSFARP